MMNKIESEKRGGEQEESSTYLLHTELDWFLDESFPFFSDFNKLDFDDFPIDRSRELIYDEFFNILKCKIDRFYYLGMKKKKNDAEEENLDLKTCRDFCNEFLEKFSKLEESKKRKLSTHTFDPSSSASPNVITTTKKAFQNKKVSGIIHLKDVLLMRASLNLHFQNPELAVVVEHDLTQLEFQYHFADVFTLASIHLIRAKLFLSLKSFKKALAILMRLSISNGNTTNAHDSELWNLIFQCYQGLVQEENETTKKNHNLSICRDLSLAKFQFWGPESDPENGKIFFAPHPRPSLSSRAPNPKPLHRKMTPIQLHLQSTVLEPLRAQLASEFPPPSEGYDDQGSSNRKMDLEKVVLALSVFEKENFEASFIKRRLLANDSFGKKSKSNNNEEAGEEGEDDEEAEDDEEDDKFNALKL